jgi:hypothetical protein
VFSWTTFNYNRTIFISAWFLGIQIMMTLTLVMEIMTVLIAILLLIKCCPGKHSVIGLLMHHRGGLGLWLWCLAPLSCFISGFVTRVTRQVPLVEQELLTIPEHLSSLLVFSGVRVTRSLVLYVCFVDRCLSFCTFLLVIVIRKIFYKIFLFELSFQ